MALWLNVALVVTQVVAGIAAGSVGLLADAGHNLSDVAAVVISLLAVRLAMRPPTPRRSFGYHRATILAAQANAASVLVVTLLVAVEAVRRLGDPPEVQGVTVAVIAAVAVVVNLAAARVLHGHGDHDLNLRSALMHMVGDAAASAVVLGAGVAIALTGGWAWLDPVASLAVATFVSWRAVGLLRETADVLLETAPAHLDVAAVAAVVAADPAVEDVHDLHAWSLSSEVNALSAHLVLRGQPSLAEAQTVADRVRHTLADRFGIVHTTLELECDSCVTADRSPCAISGRSAADAPRPSPPPRPATGRPAPTR